MALLPKNHHRKTRLFAPSRPNYSDFNSPPDGDYVRYVENLMAWPSMSSNASACVRWVKSLPCSLPSRSGAARRRWRCCSCSAQAIRFST